MKKGENVKYRTIIAQRVKRIIELSGLEIIGFADFAGISESHLYAILNGNRELTGDIAENIGAAFNLKGGDILRPTYRIPSRIKKSDKLNNFYKQNSGVTSYFVNTRPDRKESHYIEQYLLQTNIFNQPIYVWELVDYCNSKGKKYTSKRLSQILEYLVEKKKLKHKKQPLKLRSGGYGIRMVYVYYKR